MCLLKYLRIFSFDANKIFLLLVLLPSYFQLFYFNTSVLYFLLIFRPIEFFLERFAFPIKHYFHSNSFFSRLLKGILNRVALKITVRNVNCELDGKRYIKAEIKKN